MFPHLPPTTEPQDPRSRLRSLSQHLKIYGHNLWLHLFEQKVLWCCLNSHYCVVFGAVQVRIHTCTSHFKSASVVRDQEVLSEPYDDDEMGLGVWSP